MIESQQQFINQYQDAVNRQESLESFATRIGIKPNSVIRKLYRFKELGYNFPKLQSQDDLQLSLPIDNSSINTDLIIPKNPHLKVDHTAKGSRTIVITSAQNATKICKPFLQALQNYCSFNDAELYVIPYRYRNPTSMWTLNNENDDWWDSEIVEYLVNDYIQLTKSLRLFGPVKTQPTAKNPLSGYDTVSGLDSAIFGHPKIQLTTVPTPSQEIPKILTTTGAITVPNYTDSKAGFQGDFHHSLAALIVEIDSDGFYLRHIHADNDSGEFYDLDKFYTATNVIIDQPIAGLVTGDSHASVIDPIVYDTTYNQDNPNSLVNVLKPKQIVLHDVEDFYPRNHHHKNNIFLAYGKQKFGRNNVEEGLQITADFIDSIPKGIKRVIVKSNHDEAFDRWLKETDITKDPENCRFYHYMMYHMLKSIKKTDTGYSTMDPFKFWCFNPDEYQGLQNKDDVLFLQRDQSYTISDIEVGFHGDKGPNGSRGTIQSFAKVGPKTVIGHSHSPGIYEGVYQVGVSARLNLEYVSGPSGWLNTHCIIYASGHRTLIHIINGKWKMIKKEA